MTQEFPFLLACVRSFFDPKTPQPNAAGLDWRKLTQLAERHAVVALVCQAIRARDDIPAEILDYLQGRALQAARFDLTLSAELGRLVKLFEVHDIQVVSLKGPALRYILYGDATLRSSSDLDLLVRPEDVLRAKRALEGAGYYMQSIVPSKADRACLRRRDCQITLSRKITQDDLLFVDLHWRLLPGYFPRFFDERKLWGCLRQVSVAGAEVSTLAPEHLLLFLCAHGTKHLWERLGWLCDIARLVQVETGMDWTKVFSEARQTDSSRMVVLGLLLASELLGVTLPSAAVEYVSSDGDARELVETVRQRLYDEILTPASAMESASFSRRAFERTGPRVRFLVGVFLEPTEAEYEALKLPLPLHWLYYLFRPLRLGFKYGRAQFLMREKS